MNVRKQQNDLENSKERSLFESWKTCSRDTKCSMSPKYVTAKNPCSSINKNKIFTFRCLLCESDEKYIKIRR